MKKILFIGPPFAGKTSLRKFFFEGTPASTLLKHSEPPTVGLNYAKYDYVYTYPMEPAQSGKREKIPMQLAILDSSGQQIEEWLETQKEKVFLGTDIIFFIFDIQDWQDSQKKAYCKDLLKRIMMRKIKLSPDANFYILAHKVDLLNNKGTAELLKQIKSEFRDYIFEELMMMLELDVHFTSLEESFRKDTFLLLLDLTTSILSHL